MLMTKGQYQKINTTTDESQFLVTEIFFIPLLGVKSFYYKLHDFDTLFVGPH